MENNPTRHYKIAAYIAILLALLKIPLNLVDLADYFSGEQLLGVLPSLLDIPVSLLFIYVLKILGRVLRPASIIWPIRFLVLYLAVNLIADVVHVLFYELSFLLQPLDKAMTIFYTIAIFSLSIRLLSAKQTLTQLRFSNSYAICNMITVISSLSVLLFPLYFVSDLVANFLLAALFFKLDRQAESGSFVDTETPKRDMNEIVVRAKQYQLLALSTLFLGVLVSIFCVLLIKANYPFRMLFISESANQRWLLLLSSLFFLALANYVASVFEEDKVARSLTRIAYVGLVGLVVLLLVSEVPAIISGISFLDYRTLEWSLFFVIAILAIVLVVDLNSKPRLLMGFEKVISAGFLLIAVGGIVYNAGVVRIIGYFSISLIGLVFMLTLLRSGYRDEETINKWQSIGYFASVIVFPVLLYCSLLFYGMYNDVTGMLKRQDESVRQMLNGTDPSPSAQGGEKKPLLGKYLNGNE